MEEVPGKDNYVANLTDVGFNAEGASLDYNTGKLKNVGFYHRVFKVGRKDAMGLSFVHRGFSDENMFAAMTSQKEVAGLEIPNPKKCKWVIPKGGRWRDRKRVCDIIHQKWTWAIPLEIIYLTPLQKWNPLNIEYKGSSKSEHGKTVTANRRYGQCRKDESGALNGTNSVTYFRTPYAFFAGSEAGSDPADTSRNGGACALDQKGDQHRVMASGVRVFLPNIPGVGVLRTRYPIMPVHGEGSSVWKELNAIKEILMNPKAHEKMLWDANVDTSGDSEWQMSYSNKGTSHTHTITLSASELSQLQGGRELQVITSQAQSHEHSLKIRWDSTNKRVFYSYCGATRTCRDGHGRSFTSVDNTSNMVE